MKIGIPEEKAIIIRKVKSHHINLVLHPYMLIVQIGFVRNPGTASLLFHRFVMAIGSHYIVTVLPAVKWVPST